MPHVSTVSSLVSSTALDLVRLSLSATCTADQSCVFFCIQNFGGDFLSKLWSRFSFNLGGDPIEFLLALRPLARLLQQKHLAGREPPSWFCRISQFSSATNCLPHFETKLTCTSAASAGRLMGCGTCNQTSFDHLSIQHFLFHFLSGKPDHRGPAVRIH